MAYLFVFGNTPELSRLELASFGEVPDPLKIADKLGGTIKIAKKLGDISSLEEVPGLLTAHMVSLNQPKVDFGISGPGTEFLKTIKRSLEDQGIKARFVLPKEGNELSSVVVVKQKLLEFIVQKTDSGFAIGQTIWVQDFESWNKRDYDRPAVDPHKGMLPPKVARMMVNIATGPNNPGGILDPFCGVGTVLTEALMVGKTVVGSDVSQSQVEKTRKNIDWLKATYNLKTGESRIYLSDARDISKKLNQKITAVVTEPDLGPNTGKMSDLTNKDILMRLANLYSDGLKDWQRVLSKEGKVVMIIPSWTTSQGDEVHLVKTVLDRAKIMGYSEFHNSIEYFRPQAIVKRNIVFLKNGTH